MIKPALCLIATLSAIGLPASQQDDLHARLAKAFAAIDRAVAASTQPGTVVAITNRDRTLTVIAHGYADLKTKTPMTPETPVALGSISKSFTAIALMQLADEGRFDPQQPATRYLPWFETASKFGPITGHHLLTHTAGLPNYRPDLASMRYATYALRDFEIAYAPGAHFWYSNLGFQSLGYMLERIDGAAYPEIIKRRILARAGMSSTESAIDDRLRTKLPASYAVWPYDGTYLEQPWFEYRAADGSIVSTAGDMAAYLRVVLNRGAAPSGRVLTERAFTQLTTPALNNYAYGVESRQVDGDVVIQHGGAIAGFVTWMEAHMNDGFGVFVGGNGGVNVGLRGWIANTVKAAIRDQPLPELPARQSAAQLKATAAQWAGIYRGPDGSTIEFVAGDDGLGVKQGDTVVPLVRIGAESFRSTAPGLAGLPFIFERAGGKVVEVSRGADWYANDAYSGPREFQTPAEYAAYVGRYENHNPEDAVVRVVVTKGQLVIEGTRMVAVAPGQFRPAVPDYNPERYRFDSVVDGHALRLIRSGMPMYRVDAP